MTHNEKRYSAVREGQIALFTGSIYGAVHTLTGHPLDTIKSKMQLQLKYSKMNALGVARGIFQEFGLRGFMHGCVSGKRTIFFVILRSLIRTFLDLSRCVGTSVVGLGCISWNNDECI